MKKSDQDSKKSQRTKNIPIIYEDEFCLIVDKPAKLLVCPTPKKEKHTLVDLLNRSIEDGQAKLHLCHRLDRDTSGLLILAKGKKNQKMIMDLFKEKGVHKLYTAIVHGKLEKSSGEFRKSVLSLDRKRFSGERSSKPALTRYKLIKQYKNFCSVEAEPVTGRSNQIRIHFASAGHPLLGERKYAFAKDFEIKCSRVALHASQLEFTLPQNKKNIKVKSQLPKDMEVILERSRNKR